MSARATAVRARVLGLVRPGRRVEPGYHPAAVGTGRPAASGGPRPVGAGPRWLRGASWGAVTLSVLLLLAVSIFRAGQAEAPRLTAAVPTAARVSPALAAVLPPGFTKPVATAVQHAPPVEMVIPVIAVRSRLVGLRLNNDGTLQVPVDFAVAGWFADGSSPGDSGVPAIFAGHVDSFHGPGVFFRLPQVKAGDAVLVRRADGRVLRFVVYSTVQYRKSAFPSAKVYAAGSSPELRLITCSGTFDQGSKHYESNLVVSARLAAAPAAHG